MTKTYSFRDVVVGVMPEGSLSLGVEGEAITVELTYRDPAGKLWRVIGQARRVEVTDDSKE